VIRAFRFDYPVARRELQVACTLGTYNLLFRWFVGLSMDDPVWDPTVFTKNRERLLQGDNPSLIRAGAALCLLLTLSASSRLTFGWSDR
jgi:Transposase domain (DUF772)